MSKIDDSNPEGAPALLDELSPVILEDFDPLSLDTPLDEMVTTDLKVSNNMMSILHHAFTQATSIKTVVSLIGTTMKVMEQRRKTWMIKNAPQGKAPSNGTIFPI